jgi:hypothetical protein
MIRIRAARERGACGRGARGSGEQKNMSRRAVDVDASLRSLLARIRVVNPTGRSARRARARSLRGEGAAPEQARRRVRSARPGEGPSGHAGGREPIGPSLAASAGHVILAELVTRGERGSRSRSRRSTRLRRRHTSTVHRRQRPPRRGRYRCGRFRRRQGRSRTAREVRKPPLGSAVLLRA